MGMHITRHAASLGAAILLWGCTSEPMPKWPVSTPAQLCEDPSLGPDGFCMPAARIEQWLERGDYRITKSARSTSGTTRPYKLRLELDNGLSINVKYKRAPDDLEAFNNSPRRELAAYAIQKLFLDPDEYVVPPTVLVCLPTSANAELLPDLEPHPGVDCALGIMAYWVEGLTDENVIDKDRWSTDAAYRDNLGNLNVLTALIGHQDDIGTNFYRAKDPARPRLVSVDNGLAIGAMGDNPVRFFSSAWSDVRVPVLPKRTIERLSALDRAALDPLAVLAQLRQEGRTYQSVPPDPPLDPNEGVRTHGVVVQLGLTASEVTALDVRRAELLGAIAEKKIGESSPAPDAD